MMRIRVLIEHLSCTYVEKSGEPHGFSRVSVAPKIITPLNEIRVKAGTIIHTDVSFIGEPIPEVTWSVNSKPVITDSRSTITSIGYHTVLHIVNAKRSDSGNYHLKLKNDSGSDEGTLFVNVLGKYFSVPAV